LTHPAPWSKLLIGVSTAASAILIGVALIIWRSVPGTLGAALAGLTPATMLGGLLFVIREYRLDGPHLYVRRSLWETDVDLREFASVEIDPAAMKGSMRILGNGGLYSFSGLYWSKKLGRFRAFVTDHGRAVVLRSSERAVVVSPADPNAFIEDILGHNPRLSDVGSEGAEDQR